MSKYRLSFKTPADLLKYIEEQDIQFINCNFTDLCGKWHHIALHASSFTKETIENGITFDGSSIVGWRNVSASDMLIRLDISRFSYDPFAAQKTVKVFCDIYDPITNLAYALDPRYIAKKAQEYFKNSEIGDIAYFGSEIEFFIFDDVKVINTMNQVGYHLDSEEGPYNKGHDYATGNMGHRPTVKSGYLHESPVDSLSDIRAEMLSVIESMGVNIEKHHHEVAPSQCKLGIGYDTLIGAADSVQLYKHAVHNVAHGYGKSATFMPKPINGDNGSGMSVHQSLWKNGKPLFSGDEYANLSETALYYIGGILKHANALNAFTNPTTNSYKRLIPGYNAPVLLTYSARNRSAACRIPYADKAQSRRIDVRFPDPTANPYLAFAAMLMAGLDGIENKVHPGEAMDKNLYKLSKDEADKIPSVSTTLRQSLEILKNNHDFLLKGDVFTKELIDAYIDLKMEEVKLYETITHPIEVDMYYSS
ncbi:MAG: type I glutamate--ammonia ligase [Alphaproteobacteria bacterium]|nr:type I glutamate--ammonia ligase [Alphaproteobacteria bacterium]